MDEKIEQMEKRISRIETIFWVVGATAIIFGLAGAWGARLISTAQKNITDVTKKAESTQKWVDENSNFVNKAINKLKEQEKSSISNITKTSSIIAQNAVEKEIKNFKTEIISQVKKLETNLNKKGISEFKWTHSIDDRNNAKKSGFKCVKVNEPSSGDIWEDNFLCFKR